MKKLYSTILLTMLLCMFCPKAFAHDIAVENDDGVMIYYNYINNGTELAVTYKGDAYINQDYRGSVIIPEEVAYNNKTLKVTCIGEHAFNDCYNMTYVTIPNSVTSIGNSAFSSCSSLTSITIPNSVTSIGGGAFLGCHSLTSVTIPNSVTYIGNSAFLSCVNLTIPVYNEHIFACLPMSYEGEYTIPSTITTICGGAFYSCVGLTSVNIPNSVTSIGGGAFQYCGNLTSITIPNRVTSIEENVFAGCSSLTSITIPNSVTSIGGYAFSGCRSLTSVTIPNSVTSIGGLAFYACGSLTSVIIGNSVMSIGDQAFSNCTSLTSVTIPNSVTSIGERAFDGYELKEVISKIENPFIINTNTFSDKTFNNATLYVPVGTRNQYKATEGWKKFVNIEDGIYKLTYLVDNEEYKSYELEEGETIIPEEEPTKEGYSFSGWSEIPETMPAHDVTVTGSFSINKYKLIYTVDSEEYKSYDVEYGAAITPESEPTKEGYSFSGWSEIPETMPAHDVTVTGTFTINKYKVTYMVENTVIATQDVEYGATIVPPTTDSDGNTITWSSYPTTMPAYDITIYGSYATTGICVVSKDSKVCQYYTIDGHRIDTLPKGVNIIITNGNVRKVMVK